MLVREVVETVVRHGDSRLVFERWGLGFWPLTRDELRSILLWHKCRMGSRGQRSERSEELEDAGRIAVGRLEMPLTADEVLHVLCLRSRGGRLLLFITVVMKRV